MEIAGSVQRRPLILVSLLLAAFVINLDITIVNVALPTLVRELHASNSQLQWVVDAYNLVFAALLLAAGSFSDRLGRKGFLLAGLLVFGAASIAGGLTDSAGQLIFARCFMGLGSALIEPPGPGGRSGRPLAGFAGAGVLFASFILRERTAAEPMLDVSLFRNLRFTAASGSVTVAFFGITGFSFLITQYFQFLKGYSPLSTGVRLLPVAFSVGLMSVLGTQLAVRFGTKQVVTVGLLFFAGFFAWVSTPDTGTSS